MSREINANRFLRSSFLSRASISWIILLFSAAIIIVVWSISKDYYHDRSEKIFQSSVHENLDHIERRLLRYENALRSGIAFFHGSESVGRQAWHQFVETLQPRKYYPGFQGIGFSVMLHPDEVSPLEQRMRNAGYPPFALKPAGKREQYSAILYLEPMNRRNAEAVGYDMFSDPLRREAMERARDTALPSVSGPVILVQEIDSDVQPGFLMYLPLYKLGEKTNTIAARRSALLGFVYSPFRMKDLMSAIALKDSLLNFEIYDGQEMSDNVLLYRSFEPSSYVSKYNSRQSVQIGGRQWSIHFSSTPEFDAAVESKYP
ncbi:MAG: CHASE domain-containing protein, partial [Thiovulaceae bacterium]|nr:CHASE domain-containing protein [Sulfurimonadaceae bacterium]